MALLARTLADRDAVPRVSVLHLPLSPGQASRCGHLCVCVCVCVCVVQRATPSSTAKASTGTLDERLAQLRQQRQRDAAAASANKSVAFAGDEPAASINVARARPMTAPVAQVLTSTLHSDLYSGYNRNQLTFQGGKFVMQARAAGSRLASGAARVTAKTAKGSGPGTNSQKYSVQ